jgi:hypothetical protein
MKKIILPVFFFAFVATVLVQKDTFEMVFIPIKFNNPVIELPGSQNNDHNKQKWIANI